jgi:hypothetical protein
MQETGIKTREIDPIGIELSDQWYIKNITELTEAFAR